MIRVRPAGPAWLAALLGLASGACMGEIAGSSPSTADPDPVDDTATPNDPPPPAMGVAPDGTACTHLDPVPRRLWRLSNAQYGNAVRDLLGLAAAPQVSGGASTPFTFFSADSEVVSAPLAFSYSQVAEAAALAVAPRVPQLAACAPGAGEEACAARFVREFGSRAFRRPLLDAEATELLAVYRTGRAESFAAGIQAVIEVVLQAPSFVFRSELGARSAEGGHSLSAHEIAAQLSFLLLDSIPDAELWAAAQDGGLLDEAVRARQIERLLDLPAVQRNVDRIVAAWFGTRRILVAQKDAARFPGFTDAYRAALLEESDLFIHDVLWTRRAPVHELVTSVNTFVNPELAQLYGVRYPAGTGVFRPVALPPAERAGLLTQASILGARAHAADTSVVERGLFMREAALCLDEVPSPPPGLLDSPDIQSELATLKDERERAVFRTTNAICSTCHGAIDAFGLLFEGYDAVGRYRAGSGQVVDTTAVITEPPVLAGAYPDALALARALADSGTFARCASTRLLSYALGRRITGPPRCEVAAVHDAATRAGGGMAALLRALTQVPALRARY